MTSPPPDNRPARNTPAELQALLDATVDAVIVVDRRGYIESFNQSGERLFGYRTEEVLGRNVSMLMTQVDRDSHDEYMNRYLDTGVPHIIGIGREVDARRKDGSVFPVFLSVGRIHGSDPPRFVGLLHDITLRREAMAALRRERDRANMYLEMAQVILLALSVEHRVQLINRKGCDTLGRREMELLGLNWLEIALPEDQRELLLRELRELAESGKSSERYFEHEVISATGERRLLAWRCIAMRNLAGHLTGFFASGEDITDERAASEQAQIAQQRMAQVSSLATMGEMAAGIAHELNQPLAAIANYANAAQRLLTASDFARIDPDGDVQLALDQIGKQALRAGEIIRRLRALVQNRETQREPAEVNSLIDEVLGFAQSEARLNEVRIVRDFASELPTALLDRIQIQQILLNLVRNAIEALGECPPARREITVRSRQHDERVLIIEILDNGPGVPAAVLDRIFDPFCTTKPTGTGLGLAISRTIAEAHQGRLTHEAPAAGGARFILQLPCLLRRTS